MDFDLDAETNELRNRSAINSRVIMTILCTIIFGAISIGIGFVPDVREGSGWWPFVVGVAIFVVGAIVGYWNYGQAKRLLDSGVVVKATLQSVTKLPKGVYRVRVSYELSGQSYDKTIGGVPGMFVGGMEGAGFVLLAVLPDSPKIGEPLYHFATRKESLDVICGKRGLVDPAA